MNKSKFLAVWLIVLIAPAVFGQNSARLTPQPQRPIHMLVIGDSIVWGQGLKTERKTWYLVKLWLEKNTGRKVIERIETHSGAVIERASATDNLTSDNREVNPALPTLHDQLDNALKEYADPAQVDLVLLSGCGNNVGLLNQDAYGVPYSGSNAAGSHTVSRPRLSASLAPCLRQTSRNYPSYFGGG